MIKPQNKLSVGIKRQLACPWHRIERCPVCEKLPRAGKGVAPRPVYFSAFCKTYCGRDENQSIIWYCSKKARKHGLVIYHPTLISRCYVNLILFHIWCWSRAATAAATARRLHLLRADQTFWYRTSSTRRWHSNLQKKYYFFFQRKKKSAAISFFFSYSKQATPVQVLKSPGTIRSKWEPNNASCLHLFIRIFEINISAHIYVGVVSVAFIVTTLKIWTIHFAFSHHLVLQIWRQHWFSQEKYSETSFLSNCSSFFFLRGQHDSQFHSELQQQHRHSSEI